MAKNNNPGRILKSTKTTATLKGASGIWTLDEAMQAHRANAWPQPNLFQPVANSLRTKNYGGSSTGSYGLRFGGRASTPTQATFSGWIKRGNNSVASDYWIFGSNQYNTSSTIPPVLEVVFKGNNGGANDHSLTVAVENLSISYYTSTSALFRDMSAWYHIHVAYDSTQATNTNRIKIWVNGVQLTAMSGSSWPPQGTVIGTQTPSLGCLYLNGAPTRFFDGQMAEINFVDGYAIQPTLFGQLDTNNTWVPVAYTGTRGTNGFYLPFTNPTTSQTLGYDASLNGTATYDADQDPYRGSVALHLTGNGPAGGNNNTFADSGPNNQAISKTASPVATSFPAQGSFSPFPLNTNTPYNPAVHGASAYFPGSNTTLTSTVPAFGTGNFTIEFWYYPTDLSGTNRNVLDNRSTFGDSTSPFIRSNSSNGAQLCIVANSATQYAVTPTLTVNTWQHIAFVRTSGSVTSYVNGVAGATTALATNFTSTSLLLGGFIDTQASPYGTTAYISSLRITPAAVYTAAFTPAMRPFGTLTNNLLTFSEDFTVTWTPASITVLPNATVAPDGTPSGTGLLATTSDPYFMYTISVTSGVTYTASIYVKGSANTIGKIGYFWWWIAGTATGTNTFSPDFVYTNNWQRISVSFTPTGSGTVILRLEPGDTSRTPPVAAGDISYVWGAQLETGGTATNYTPTPANFSTAPSLLLNFANAAVVDSAGAGNIVTASGAAITSASKYGSGALAFNGSSDYYQSTWSLSSFLSPGTNNWTLETWVYMTKSLSSAQVIVNYGYESVSTRSFVWYYNGDGTFRLAQSPDGSTNYDAGFGAPQGGFQLNTWYHLAIVRNFGSMTMYVNGKAMPNTLSAYTISSISTGVFRVGVDSSNYFGGSMDDVRFTKGVARYTSDFAPPARALPETGGKSFTTVNVNAGVVQRFTTTGTTSWTAPVDVTSIEVLVVAGGGSGGNFHGGGGGAGGVIYNNQYPVTPGQTYTVVVGAGGSAVTVTRGINGGNSQFGNLIAVGGGGGGNEQINRDGLSGGSGGGSSYGAGRTIAPGTAGQGFAGGIAPSAGAAYAGAGGGGAGGVGGDTPNTSQGGAGGVGLQFGISGTPAFYAAGGGGSVYNAAGIGTGGSGIGGNGGSFSSNIAATSGATNTGSGGGGGERASGANNSGAGGSGIVIVRYTTTAVGNTSDATTDNLVDSPTQYGHDSGAGGEVVGNYATMNPLMGSTLPTFSNGNLTTTGNSGSSSFGCVYSSIAMTSGNWYAEVRLDVLGTNQTQLGIASYLYPRDNSNQNGLNNGVVAINFDNSLSAYRGVYQNGSVLTGGNVGMTFSAGDIIGVAFNATARTVAFYQNGVILGSSSPYSVADVGTGQFYFVGLVGNSASTKLSWNFGQRAWAYAPPAGFGALTTKNLPRLTNSAAIAPNQYFGAVLYTGTGAAQTITLPGAFQPDLVWIKSRSNAYSHWIGDSVRGFNVRLYSDGTAVEASNPNGGVTAVSSTGFTVSAGAETNNTSNNYVAWCWRAGGTAVSNTSGTITSQVSANTTSGFSIVTYTGGATGATVGHGLGATPAFVITKCRNATQYWIVHHQSIAITSNLYLQTTDGTQPDSQYTAKSATTLTLGSNVNSVNTTGNTYVSYCWAEVAGVSKFGSYDGNSSIDGPFIYCGFKPALVIIKGTFSSVASQWYVYDSSRDTFNPVASRMLLNTSGTEALATDIDFVSNGFKLRYPAGGGGLNSTGSTYIYMAFAEKPFGNVNGTAR